MSQHMNRYDMKLPNKQLFQALRVLGIVLTTTGPLMALGLLVVWMFVPWFRYPEYYVEPEGIIPYLYNPNYYWIAVAMLVIGVVLVSGPGQIFRKYYRIVPYGKVVDKNITGGGNVPLQWYVTVEGHTYANELRQFDYSVSAGEWDEIMMGQVVDFS